NTPRMKAAIKRYQDNVAPWMNRQYRTTAGLKDSDPVPFHGRYFEAPVNLLANSELAKSQGAAPVGSGSNPTNPRKNFNPFRSKATGAAEGGYTNDLHAMLENSVNTVYSK